MNRRNETNNVRVLWLGTVVFAILLLCATALVFFFLPQNVEEESVMDNTGFLAFESLATQPAESQELFTTNITQNKGTLGQKKQDIGLELYRQENSKISVEWFYTSVTENRDVAVAILDAAEKEDIPLSLAFALAYTESRYNVNAVNRNRDASIDRGLFQLNNRSFPRIKEAEFFDPNLSANYGMSHLRFCLDTAGNEIAALAMYNAGTNKVRNDSTPQRTLNYVSNIMNYKESLDQMFDIDVVRVYEKNTDTRLAKK